MLEQFRIILGSVVLPPGYVVIAKTQILFADDKKILSYEGGKDVLLQPLRKKESKVSEVC